MGRLVFYSDYFAMKEQKWGTVPSELKVRCSMLLLKAMQEEQSLLSRGSPTF